VKILVVVAHPSDESIGLFTLRKSIVAVALWNQIEKIPEHRMEELYRLARDMGWEVYDDVVSAVVDEMIAKKLVDTVAVPSLNSRHPAHLLTATAVFEQWLNSWRYDGIRLMLYDVEMNEPWRIPLSTFTANEKKEFLLKYYPSWKDLWLYDNKYWLFEGHVVVI